ncbi:hypothetical protein FBU30_002614 [Linnemannia zychae]|nr:hypothetical protein FBU30_002614 [Linnemannia zychae]
MTSKVQRIMVQPIVSNTKLDSKQQTTVKMQKAANVNNVIAGTAVYKPDLQRSTVQIWLYDQLDTRIEGQIIGFDEFMNLVLDSAFEVDVKKNTRKQIGRILLKGDNITLIQSVSAPES